jgi:LCP family protein required for cell wall assembly
MSWVAVVASALVLLGSGTLWAYVSYLNGKIHHFGAICVRDCSDRPKEKGGTENFLLVGSDSRAGDNSTGALSGLANGSGGNGLSDSTMLVHLSADTGRVVVVSFPRDMLVDMPGYTDSHGVKHDPSAQKFNAAYSYGGPQLLVKQVENLTGLRVDHYVGIDFAGFIKIVDALGGINVCITAVPGLTTNLHDPGDSTTGGSGFVGHVGINHLNGFHALQYVRQRHGLPQGDLDRIQRQHRFLAAVFAKVQSAGTLLNPLKLHHVLAAAASDLSTDNGTKPDDLITLAQKLRDLSGNSVEYFTVPTTFGPQISGLGSVLYPVKDQARALFQAVYDDQDPAHPTAATPTKKPSATPSTAAPVLTVPPSSITVDVLNGSGIRGQAGKVGTDLQSVGFRIGRIGTAPSSGTTTTEIRYGTNRADSAKTVAAAIPGAKLVADSSLGEDVLQVITGSGYAGVQKVTVHASSGAGTASASAPATPSPRASVAPDTNGGKQTGSKSTGTEGISIAGGCGP